MGAETGNPYDAPLATADGAERLLAEYRGRPLLVQILRYYG
jgi:hypothetical protein